MFIQTEDTPNPLAMKFIPGKFMGNQQGKTYTRQDNAETLPLISSLFLIDGVEQVFFGNDFITINRRDDTDWIFLKPQILGSIMDHFLASHGNDISSVDNSKSYHDDSPVAAEIRDIIETRVRPAVAQDGGDISFDRFEDGIVYVHLQGACSGCPSSQMTLKSGIENMLKHYIPEVIEVRSL